MEKLYGYFIRCIKAVHLFAILTRNTPATFFLLSSSTILYNYNLRVESAKKGLHATNLSRNLHFVGVCTEKMIDIGKTAREADIQTIIR